MAIVVVDLPNKYMVFFFHFPKCLFWPEGNTKTTALVDRWSTSHYFLSDIYGQWPTEIDDLSRFTYEKWSTIISRVSSTTSHYFYRLSLGFLPRWCPKALPSFGRSTGEAFGSSASGAAGGAPCRRSAREAQRPRPSRAKPGAAENAARCVFWWGSSGKLRQNYG